MEYSWLYGYVCLYVVYVFLSIHTCMYMYDKDVVIQGIDLGGDPRWSIAGFMGMYVYMLFICCFCICILVYIYVCICMMWLYKE
jgi:hypothetical protein